MTVETQAKRRGNPNWGKPEPLTLICNGTEFERTAAKLRLKPSDYVTSVPLREWAIRNRNSNFVPETLLKAWGLDGDY